MSGKIRIGDKLVEYRYITEEQLKTALSLQRETGKRLGEILIEQGLITAELLKNVLIELLGIDTVVLNKSNVSYEAVQKVPKNICKRYMVFPYKIDDGKLYLAMEDPQNREAIQDVKRISGMEVEVSISTIGEINKAIELWYSSEEVDNAINEYVKNDDKEIILENGILDDNLNSAPIVKLVHKVLEDAVREKASDVHLECDGKFMRVRFRIDGVLVEHIRTSAKAYKVIVNRIKIMANLDIAERRLPQDGRIYLVVDNVPIDFRVSTMPTNKGEKVVMRVLDKSSFMVSKDKLGFSNECKEKYDRLLSHPYGLILVVGPTGSGKTTTLYSMLGELNKVEKNILTIEDPIEYELPGVNQSQVNYKAGLDFANSLRAFLRQDPDIIMVGEIRDHDTAEIAIRASLTGHLVLSTLHANSGIGAITRLSDMDIDNFLINSSLVGVVSQRLVRKICPFCKEPYSASIGEKKILNFDLNKELTLFKGKGCDKCNNKGYKGRIGIYEIIELTSEIRDLLDKGYSEKQIQDKAKEIGINTIKDDAIEKVLNGITTVEEMLRVTFINS